MQFASYNYGWGRKFANLKNLWRIIDITKVFRIIIFSVPLSVENRELHPEIIPTSIILEALNSELLFGVWVSRISHNVQTSGF